MVAFGLEREPVMHCNGDPNSRLRQLLAQYAAASGNAGPGYPTYVLVDPQGVIQDYRAGYALDEIQAKLVELTDASLTRDWAPGPAIPSYGLLPAAGTATFSIGGGVGQVTDSTGPIPDGSRRPRRALLDHRARTVTRRSTASCEPCRRQSRARAQHAPRRLRGGPRGLARCR